MSVTAETSKTVLEIYQPLFVGLGAVILGLVANGILEWVKVGIKEKAELKKLRRALYFDILSYSGSLSDHLKDLDQLVDGPLDRVSVFMPTLVLEHTRLEFGSLTREELDALSGVMMSAQSIMVVSNFFDQTPNEHGVAWIYGLNEENRDRVYGLLSGGCEVCEDFLKECRKFV